MGLIIELFKWITMGFAVFFILPLVTMILPWRHAESIIDEYQSIAMSLIGRAILLQRSHGSLTLKKTSFDPNLGAEYIRIKGEKLYFFDPNDLMSTFKNHSFGLAHEDRAVIVDARTAWFGRQLADLYNNGQLERNGHWKAYFGVTEGLSNLVNIADVKAIIQNPGGPMIPDRIDTYAEKGQSFFDRGTVMQQAQLFMALGVGFGIMWLARQFMASGGNEVGEAIPIMLGWF